MQFTNMLLNISNVFVSNVQHKIFYTCSSLTGWKAEGWCSFCDQNDSK